MLSFMVSTVALVLIPVGLIWVREAKYPSSLSFSKTSVMVILFSIPDFMEVIKVAGPRIFITPSNNFRLCMY